MDFSQQGHTPGHFQSQGDDGTILEREELFGILRPTLPFKKEKFIYLRV